MCTRLGVLLRSTKFSIGQVALFKSGVFSFFGQMYLFNIWRLVIEILAQAVATT